MIDAKLCVVGMALRLKKLLRERHDLLPGYKGNIVFAFIRPVNQCKK